MAIEQTGASSRFAISTTNSGTVSSTITVPADAQIVIVGVAGYRDEANYFSGGSMTFTKDSGDTAMTAVAGDGSNYYWMGAIFYLVLPDTGDNKSLKWNWQGSGAATNAPLISVTFWKGVNTSAPVRDSEGGNASAATSVNLTLTAQSGDKLILWGFGYRSNDYGDGTVSSWDSPVTTLENIVNNIDTDAAWGTGDPTGNYTGGVAVDDWDDGGACGLVLAPLVIASLVMPNISSRMKHLFVR